VELTDNPSRHPCRFSRYTAAAQVTQSRASNRIQKREPVIIKGWSVRYWIPALSERGRVHGPPDAANECSPEEPSSCLERTASLIQTIPMYVPLARRNNIPP